MTATASQEILTQRFPEDAVGDVLLPREAWRPYPNIDDRAAWQALPGSVRQAYVAQGEAALESDWSLLLATSYLEYARVGNRSRFQDLYFSRRGMLGSLVLAECVESEGRYLDAIANGIWLICEESSWCIPAHVGVQRAGSGLPDTTEPIVDLFAAETSALLAWTDYLLGERLEAISTLVRPRLYREVRERILTPCLQRDDFWWMGFSPRRVNNWNPWINSNWLASNLVIEQDPRRRIAAVAKSMRSLDRFVGPYPRDGGCDEGPGYWGRAGASLLDCLELLHCASDGKIDVYDIPLIQEMGRYIYRAQIDDSYFVNFADASAIVRPPPAVVFRYGQRIGDPDLAALGAWLAEDQDVLHPSSDRRGSLGRLLPTLFMLDELTDGEPRMPLPRDVWLWDIEVMATRDREGSSRGLYLAAKGGHNAESHNHNDVGSFVVYVDGRPLIIDAGVETYSRKTFSPQRYEIWTMQSAYHSLLPTIDGVMQAPGQAFAARDAEYEANDQTARLSLDIAGAYPQAAGLESWVRTITLQRGHQVEIVDHYVLGTPAKEIVLSVLTPATPHLVEPGRISFVASPLPDGRLSGAGQLAYDPEQLEAAVEEVPITDERLNGTWGSRLRRIVFTARTPTLRGTWSFRISAGT
ncbi:MAG TPA: heparinase II/III family protein [Anaerolineae bacterium]|nr:heparinase II/III family protein [Anaerolineae bacterium]